MVPAVYEKYHVILSIPVEPNSSYYKDSDFLLYTKNLPNKKTCQTGSEFVYGAVLLGDGVCAAAVVS